MTEILSSINGDMLPTEIYLKVSKKMSVREFYDGLSFLYAIQKVNLLKNGRIRKC